ncbi:MAG: EamA family transporter [Succinivibrio sp.]|nr:EamA family transporter [Succinivibrio sp.]
MLIKNEKSRFIIGCMFALLGGAAYAVGGSCGQIIAGIVCGLIFRPWHYDTVIYNSDLFLFMSGVIGIGTIVSFSTFLYGVKLVGGVVSNVLCAIEPVISVFICLYALNIPLTGYDVAGMTIVVMAIFILSVFKGKRQK